MKESHERILWLIGYGAWPVAKRAKGLVETLTQRGVSRLVDVRLSPCSSDIDPTRPYGPKPWNLQEPGKGIEALLTPAGIRYDWVGELGNPQRLDPEMKVLRAHLDDVATEWPVHRGLKRLASIVEEPGESVCLLCACADGAHCHRTLIAQSLNDRYFASDLSIREAKP